MRKRIFDIVVCIAGLPIWLPVVAITALALLVANGWPVFYVSPRRVFQKQSIRLFKFRTMIRNADRVANRDTIPVSRTRFLNIPSESKLHTPLGRFVERFQFTELPQLFHVLAGTMSLVGNRPLPENVIASLSEVFPHAPNRFMARCGITGPVQLVGREDISDDERLRLEIAYCRLCAESYSMSLDLMILVRTALLVLGLVRALSVSEAVELLERYGRRPVIQVPRTAAAQEL